MDAGQEEFLSRLKEVLEGVFAVRGANGGEHGSSVLIMERNFFSIFLFKKTSSALFLMISLLIFKNEKESVILSWTM